MRNFTLTLGFCLWLLGAAFAQPSRSAFINRLVAPSQTKSQIGKANSRVTGAFTRPGTSDEYSWPNATSGWVYYAEYNYLYTSDGRLMQRTSLTPNSSQPIDQISYTYVGQQLTEKIRKVRQNNAWVNDTREVYSYDAQGNLQEMRSESWNNGAWTIDDGIRYVSTYNAAGQLTGLLTQIWVLSWENSVRETYTLGAGNTWTEVLVELWDQTAWVNSEKITNLVWHNWNRRELQSYLLKGYSPVQNAWVNTENAAITYATTQQTLQLDRPVPNGWEPKYRYTQYFDQTGNYLGFLDEEQVNQAWVRNNETKITLQFDASQNITERLTQVLDYNNQTLVNTTKSVYRNFQSFNISGTRPELAAANVKVFPNPATENVNVTITNAQFKPASAALIDLSGRLVLQQDFGKQATLPEFTLPVAQLPAGVYLLQLTSDTGEQLKQRLVKN